MDNSDQFSETFFRATHSYYTKNSYKEVLQFALAIARDSLLFCTIPLAYEVRLYHPASCTTFFR
jgi:hypothetical protein